MIRLKYNNFSAYSAASSMRSMLLRSLSCVVLVIASSGYASASTGLLDYADAMRSIYKVNNEKSAAAPNMAELNKAGVDSANCQNQKQAQASAAQIWMTNKLPPDPTTVIANTSCFIDVMDISIPVTGNGFLDSVMSSLSPFLKSSACNKTASWWNDTKSKVTGGQFASLDQQFSTALNTAQNVSTQINQTQNSAPVQSGTVSNSSSASFLTPLSQQMNSLRQLMGL